jgi:toxin YoeB
MSYQLDFSYQAKSDINFHKKSGNKAILKKLFVLLNELTEHPFEGTGKPEPLKHILTGSWSRRINLEHRLIYEVLQETVLIYSAKGHYN